MILYFINPEDGLEKISRKFLYLSFRASQVYNI